MFAAIGVTEASAAAEVEGGIPDVDDEDTGGRPEAGGRPERVPCDDALLVDADEGRPKSSSRLCAA